MRYLFLILLFIGTTASAQLYNQGKSTRFGVKTALNMSTYGGDEFVNPSMRFGYTAGVYIRSKISKSTHFHGEILGNFKGSNFRNTEDNDYIKIAAFHLDVPLYMVWSMMDNKHNFMLGPQVSYHVFSSLYLKGNPKAHLNNLNFTPVTLDACVAYQLNGPVVSPQIGFKFGLTDLNNGISFEDVNPPTGNGGFIRSISIELGLIF